jgi:transcriptional regulator with XRE-family HTH domain
MYANNDFNTPRKRLFILRKVFSYTQKEMAKVCEMPTRSYQRLEYGEMGLSAETIYRFSKIFEITPSYFFIGAKLEEAIETENNVLDASSHDFIDILKITENLTENLSKVPSSVSNYTTTQLNKKLQKYLNITLDTYKHKQSIKNLEAACLNFYQLARIRDVMFLSDVQINIEGNTGKRTLAISRVKNPNLDHLSLVSIHHDISEFPRDYNFDTQKLASIIEKETGVRVIVLDSIH